MILDVQSLRSQKKNQPKFFGEKSIFFREDTTLNTKKDAHLLQTSFVGVFTYIWYTQGSTAIKTHLYPKRTKNVSVRLDARRRASRRTAQRQVEG